MRINLVLLIFYHLTGFYSSLTDSYINQAPCLFEDKFSACLYIVEKSGMDFTEGKFYCQSEYDGLLAFNLPVGNMYLYYLFKILYHCENMNSLVSSFIPKSTGIYL